MSEGGSPPVALRVLVYSDGASRGNPGLAGAGWVIDDTQHKTSYVGHMFLGKRTNNEAEYLAALMGLQAAHDLQAQEVTLRADSELLVRQLQGVYRVKNARLAPLYQQVLQQIRLFRRFTVEHVRREYNTRADQLANVAIDEHLAAC